MSEDSSSIIDSEKYWETRFGTGDWTKFNEDKHSIFFCEGSPGSFTYLVGQ